MDENVIVFLIVGGAALYAAWRFMPGSLKRSLARMLGASEKRAHQIGSAGACGSCDSCKACATPAEQSGQPIHLHK
jgi:hypothetical protein